MQRTGKASSAADGTGDVLTEVRGARSLEKYVEKKYSNKQVLVSDQDWMGFL